VAIVVRERSRCLPLPCPSTSGEADSAQGYGFDIQCSGIDFVPWDTSTDSAIRQMYQSSDTNQHGSLVPAFNSSTILLGAPDDTLLFNSSDDTGYQTQIAADKKGWFQVTSLFKTDPVCGGNVSVRKCSLHHGVVEYHVAWSNNTLSLGNEHWQDDTVLFHTYVSDNRRSF
jgi:hypothetical protein